MPCAVSDGTDHAAGDGWTAHDIEALRLIEIAYLRRVTGARAAPVNVPSEWIGWQVLAPDRDARMRRQRAAEGTCTRCGGTPRAGLKTRQLCADAQAARAAAQGARRVCRLRRAGR